MLTKLLQHETSKSERVNDNTCYNGNHDQDDQEVVKNEIVICREYNKTHLNMNNVVIVKPNEEKLWDYRFVVKSKFKKLR